MISSVIIEQKRGATITINNCDGTKCNKVGKELFSTRASPLKYEWKKFFRALSLIHKISLSNNPCIFTFHHFLLGFWLPLFCAFTYEIMWDQWANFCYIIHTYNTYNTLVNVFMTVQQHRRWGAEVNLCGKIELLESCVSNGKWKEKNKSIGHIFTLFHNAPHQILFLLIII